jgi:DNA-binding GntR family transcriptional regulator
MSKGVFSIQKLQKRSTEVQAADTLREAIISGAIPLGARLTEISAAEQLGVSRSTIRTAFHQLVQEGLVIQTPYTGWSVMSLSAKDAWELYTLRASLEAMAAKLVADRVSREGNGGAAETAVNKAFSDLKVACKAGDNRQVAAADMTLHKTIITFTDHSRLIDQYSRLQHQISIYIQSSDGLVAGTEEIVGQHLPLIQAISAGDGEAAMRFVMEHNETEGAVLVNHLNESPRRSA